MKVIIKNNLIFLCLLGIALLFQLLNIDNTFIDLWFSSHILAQGGRGILLYCLIAAVFSACGVPRQILMFYGGYAFGFGFGLIWGSIGLTIGCAFGFFFAKGISKNFEHHKSLIPHLSRTKLFLIHKPFAIAVAIRLFPFGNNAITNMVAGANSISALPFIAGSSVGYLPQNIIFALLGSGTQVDSEWQIILSILLFICSTALGIAIYRHFQKTQLPLKNEPSFEVKNNKEIVLPISGPDIQASR